MKALKAWWRRARFWARDLDVRILRPFIPFHRWYSDFYLNSAWWRHRAIRARRDAEYRCADCGQRQQVAFGYMRNKTATYGYMRILDVHHVSQAALFNEGAGDLVVLCRECHMQRGS